MGGHLALVEGAEVGEAGFGGGICCGFFVGGVGVGRVVFGDFGEGGAALAGAAVGVFS